MQIPVQVVQVVDPVQHADLEQRLIEEPIRIASCRMAAGVEPQFVAPFAPCLFEVRIPQIEMAQLWHVDIQLPRYSVSTASIVRTLGAACARVRLPPQTIPRDE